MSRPTGTDGSDFGFRQRVESQYSDSVRVKGTFRKLNAGAAGLTGAWLSLVVAASFMAPASSAASSDLSSGTLHPWLVGASFAASLIALALGNVAIVQNNTMFIRLFLGHVVLDLAAVGLAIYFAFTATVRHEQNLLLGIALPALLVVVKGFQLSFGRRLLAVWQQPAGRQRKTK
ncbi:hypothetical protein CAOG_04443 [Capsaspora owczarzaki ATCC 30864]|uniref:Uncharacterized protein n=1 Tax=Capsaspora owczarzaki (strain ATCC 30864) TaxID=595528 RepID=A0A0D2X349_CAPO3|nr:hypothetical protein CAOG_04443 [Capsaspora owczarzaki ATCC 30864]KJE93689.1 hypothetical protein CAOG_004443 [Capsaspora owczarzaki ATCC 30864]|eukprot:XP_004348271.1 hypothetical protein CAOG_04443 [Capsaspora owczarzaki ATCC 30864]